jgi:hypothetical protein
MTTCDPVAEPRPCRQGRQAVVWAAASTELGFRIVGGGRPPSTIEEVRGGTATSATGGRQAEPVGVVC